ncbi:MAG: porin family protein [Methylobacteriaceae bacterium]|nr:porin family protein [Methylobacteriaceae bacterium]
MSASSLFRTGLVAAVTVIAAPALAADLSAPAPLALPASDPLLEWGSGWYLRGDISYDSMRVGSAVIEGFTNTSLGRPKAKETWATSFGVGYKLGSMFRTDVTLEYRSAAAVDSVRLASPAFCTLVLGANISGCDVRSTTDLKTWIGMINGYVDLGNFGGVTPYVGVGLGAARTRTGGTFNSIYDRDTGNTLGYINNSLAPAGKTQLAWALMAGASIAVDKSISLDVGYRYLNLGDAATAPYLWTPAQATSLLVRGKLKNVQSHEFRVGVRYMLDN